MIELVMFEIILLLTPVDIHFYLDVIVNYEDFVYGVITLFIHRDQLEMLNWRKKFILIGFVDFIMAHQH